MSDSEFQILKRGRGRVLLSGGYQFYRNAFYRDGSSCWRCKEYSNVNIKCKGYVTLSEAPKLLDRFEKFFQQWIATLSLMDPETGKEIKEPNMIGEMWMKDVCFTEYYRNPEMTAPVFTQDGWYKTGDLLYRDQDGKYFFVERLKKVIKCRNKLILPVEVEAVIRTLPGIQECTVVSIPHEEDGEHPVACVVRKQNSAVTSQQIKDLFDCKLPESHKLRGGVEFLNEIPYTLAGKVSRRKLRKIIMVSDREEKQYWY